MGIFGNIVGKVKKAGQRVEKAVKSYEKTKRKVKKTKTFKLIKKGAKGLLAASDARARELGGITAKKARKKPKKKQKATKKKSKSKKRGKK